MAKSNNTYASWQLGDNAIDGITANFDTDLLGSSIAEAKVQLKKTIVPTLTSSQKATINKAVDAITRVVPTSKEDIQTLVWATIRQHCKPKWRESPKHVSVIDFLKENYADEIEEGNFSLADLRKIDPALCKAYENHLSYARRENHKEVAEEAAQLIPRAHGRMRAGTSRNIDASP